MIKVFAPATDNYKEQTAYAEIEIYKAKSSVTAESYQAYTYCASVIVPKYKLGSSLSEAQQEVIIQCENEAQLLNAGTYKNVTIIAKESKNFEQSSAVVTVEINRARVNLIFKDKTSVWLFDLGVNKNKVGNYTITGQIVDSANYVASIYDATYTVTAGPYYFIAIIIIAFVIILLVLLHNRKFVIEFRENGGSVIPLIETKKKKELLIKQPTKNGYRFAGWYIDSKLMIPFNGKVKRGKQLILYAKWDITKEEEIAQHTNYIVSDIMQKINPPTQQTNISNYEEYSNNLNEEIAEPKVKTEKEILNDIIQKANNNSKPANDDEMNNILTSLNMQYIIQQKQVKKEEKPKTQEEIMQELISKAAENAGNNFEQKSIDDIINNL